MDFAIFDPRVFFSVFTLTLHAYIYKRVFNPSSFTFLFNILWVNELRVKGGEGRFPILCVLGEKNAKNAVFFKFIWCFQYKKLIKVSQVV